MDAVRLHQFGINYAVATLGTATTPDHLKRIFRLVSEVVFAFDGDRAGRAAAWRALHNALPEARQGREVRFLFLPDGHDPDSLVGAEGSEAFERRLDKTVPLSDYLMRELTDQVGTLDKGGRARFSELAGPLMERLPDSVYRDLVVEQTAKVVGVSRARLEQEWRDKRRSATTGATVGTTLPTVVASRQRIVADRGSLVRQAILRLVTYPVIALDIGEEERTGLDASDERGIELLRDLIDHLKAQPAQNSAQVIERWAGKTHGDHLGKLLQREPVLADVRAATDEFHGALAKLRDLVLVRRMQALEAKDSAVGLNTEERQEYLTLTMNRASRGARGG
jgi:DNA primase